MPQSILSSLALDDWFEAYQPPTTPEDQPTSIDVHPHPLRSHSRELKRFSEPDHRPTRPESCALPQYRAHGALHSTRIIPMAAIDVPPLPSYHNKHHANASRHNVSNPSSPKDFPIVAVRPPLRPSTSSEGKYMGSYYSYTSAELDNKSLSVAAQEILDEKQRKSFHRRFHGCLVVLCLVNFMGGLNITSLSTALPVMSADLRAGPLSSLWVTIASLLTAALFQPFFMRLSAADSKSLLVFGLVLVTSGSLLSALAKEPTVAILGRSIEGCGNAANRVLTQLILDQLTAQDTRRCREFWVPTAFWFGTAMGPIIGGALAETAGWPYVFYLNIPPALLSGAAALLLIKLPVPLDSTWQKAKKVDVLGWALLSAACTSIVLAFSWAGSVHSWSSWPVLLPLGAGATALVTWVAYSTYHIQPILPVSSFSRASTMLPCIGTMMHGAIFTAIIYMAAIHFQSGLSLSAVLSGLFLLPWTISFIIVATAASIVPRGSSLPLMSCIGWALATTGIALMTMLATQPSPALAIIIGILTGTALGLLASLSRTTIQRSATTDDETIHAGPVHSFFSALGMCLGLTIASCIYLDGRSQGQDIATSLRLVWIVLTVLSSVALTQFSRSKSLHSSRLLHPSPTIALLALFSEDLAADRQDLLEALSALDGVLLEALDGEFLDGVFDALPAAAQCDDPSALLEAGVAGALAARAVDHLLLHRDELGKGHVLAAHGDLARRRVHVRDLVHHRRVVAEERLHPRWHRLPARDQPLRAQDVRLRVERARERVDGDDVRRFVVPGAVFAPVARADFVPRVRELVGRGEETHGVVRGCGDEELEAQRVGMDFFPGFVSRVGFRIRVFDLRWLAALPREFGEVRNECSLTIYVNLVKFGGRGQLLMRKKWVMAERIGNGWVSWPGLSFDSGRHVAP
nr:efflux pump fus6 [Quercus suber]